MSPEAGKGGQSIKMGEVERYQNNINGTLSDKEIQNRLGELKRDILRVWKNQKRYQRTMHGEEIKDNWIDIVLLYLIKKRIL